MTSTIFFSNSRSLEQPGLIIETLELSQKLRKLSQLGDTNENKWHRLFQNITLECVQSGSIYKLLFI